MENLVLELINQSELRLRAELMNMRIGLENQFTQLTCDHEAFRVNVNTQLEDMRRDINRMQGELNLNHHEEELAAHDRQLERLRASLDVLHNNFVNFRRLLSGEVAELQRPILGEITQLQRDLTAFRNSIHLIRGESLPIIVTSSRFQIVRHLHGNPGGHSIDLAAEIFSRREVCLHTEHRLHGWSLEFWVHLTVAQGLINLPGAAKLIGFGFDRTTDTGIWASEFMPHGTFRQMIDARHNGNLPPQFGPTQFSKVIFGVTVTMSQVHSRNVVLKVLDGDSILLDENYEPRLTNFF
jgi:hypothetical protein